MCATGSSAMTGSAPPPEEQLTEELPTGSVATMNVKNLRLYAKIKGIDVSKCERRLDLLRALAPELFAR